MSKPIEEQRAWNDPAQYAEHTPGPWYAVGVYVQSAVINEDNYVCEAEGDNRQQAEANARLIAAAPELLEACNAVLDSAELTLGDGGSVLGEQYRQLLTEAIDRAIKTV